VFLKPTYQIVEGDRGLDCLSKCDRGSVVCSEKMRSLAIINSKFFVQTDFFHYLHYYSIKMKKTQ
jgi:hypothetical protein